VGRVKADPGQIEQILMNLVVNARDAMPGGGHLTIEVRDAELDAAYAAAHPGAAPGSYVMLAVTDSGCGMDVQTMSRVFEPFFTTKEVGKGTGLGLATVYGIVKQSGGYVSVYSEVGRGTTFRIYLPRTDAVTEPAVPTARPEMLSAGSETILLVEDAAALREMSATALRDLGYTVLEAESGMAALDRARTHPATLDLVVTDVVMPGMSGPELWKRVHEIRPEGKVLFVSGYTDDAIVRHGVLEGGTAFLPKPFSSWALARKVREVLDAPARQPVDH
jgi:CheY-like chemotaxis protein